MNSIRTFAASIIIIMFVIGQSALAKDRTEKTYDAIIIPGYPFDPDGEMNAIYKMRLLWASELYSKGIAKHIIVSGSAVHSPYVESKIFALYLEEMGVDPKHLIIEDRAEHSLENVFYSLELAKARGFEKVAVATDLFQSGMIQILGRKHDLKVDYLPANIGFIISKKWNSFDGTIDYCQAYVDDFIPLKERESKKERMHGTRGYKWVDENTLTINNAIAN
jgi:hypothetical protein